MGKYLLIAAATSIFLFAIDYYVYRNWRRFVSHRRELRWTAPAYRALLFVMPLTMPVYFYFSRWWEVEPKLVRAAFIGLWTIYYLPKAIIALALLVKDGTRFVYWLFGWFRAHLRTPAPQGAGAGGAHQEAPGLDLLDMTRMSRAAFLRKMGWTAAAVPYVVVGYSVFRDLYRFDVHRVTVPIPSLPRALDGLAIAQLSDLHAGSLFSTRPMQEAVALVQSLRPDLIVITGDYVNHDADELPLILPALQDLRADLGVYGCLGNHDHYARVQDVVHAVGSTSVDVLVNAHRSLPIDGAELHIIGTDNTGFRQTYADLPRALDGLQPGPNGDDVRLLLAHDPTYWDTHVRAGYPDIDLMLAGHTHGGQVGFELGPLRWSLARVAYARWAGLYAERGTDGLRPQYLYVNRGLGTVGPPLRLGIRPEVTLLTLTRA